MEVPLEAIQFMEGYLRRLAAFTERVMVFIDGGYWRKCLEDLFKKVDADLNKVIYKLLRGRRLVRIYFYTARIERPPDARWKNLQAEQQSFLAALAHQPFIEVRLGRLQFAEKSMPPRQKGVDVLLSLDMLRFALKKIMILPFLSPGMGTLLI